MDAEQEVLARVQRRADLTKLFNTILQSVTDDQELRLLAQLLRDRQDELHRKAAWQVRVGSHVKFKGRRGFWIYGKVTKVNQKTVIVKPFGGDPRNWKVPANMLTAMTNEELESCGGKEALASL
jgi:hypothetical protein